MNIRRATHDDYEAVVEMTSDIWRIAAVTTSPTSTTTGSRTRTTRDEDVPRDDRRRGGRDRPGAAALTRRSLVPEPAGRPRLPSARVARRLTEACFEWARDRDARIGRAIIFSWNVASLSMARAIGFEPVTEFRFVFSEPDRDASGRENTPSRAIRRRRGAIGAEATRASTCGDSDSRPKNRGRCAR